MNGIKDPTGTAPRAKMTLRPVMYPFVFAIFPPQGIYYKLILCLCTETHTHTHEHSGSSGFRTYDELSTGAKMARK